MHALFALCVIHAACAAAHARVLHIGDNSFRLDTEKHTTPALALQIDDTLFWGALYSDTAPAGTMHVKYDGMEYWLAEYCEPGTYLPAGGLRCVDCGLGHYCMGGRHRAACSGGIIGCPTPRASADVVAPEFTNRALTTDEIAENVPPTDLAQWRQVSCCSNADLSYYYTLLDDLSAVNSVMGCANNTLQPGTYLFVIHPTGNTCPYQTDPFTGNAGSYQAYMMILDHAASYKTIHALGIYRHFIDIDNPDFTDWDFSFPDSSHCTRIMLPNITSQQDIPLGLCVYELK